MKVSKNNVSLQGKTDSYKKESIVRKEEFFQYKFRATENEDTYVCKTDNELDQQNEEEHFS